jgi:hypothetical protein
MQILASPPLRTGSIVWQESPGQYSLTVVCKTTYALAPLSAPLAREPEDVNERDNHWDDDPDKSLYLPSDLVPFKPEAEVVLVGAAFAPRGEQARSLHARLVVGQVDKAIEVFGQRMFLSDGTLREGPRWTQMPLRYERAAGGEGSWNPVGVSADAVDPYGRRSLPNLQPPGITVSQPGDVIPAIGFGPIAPRWPWRRERLRGAAWSDERWEDRVLGDGFDGAFFQCAPPDQRVEAIRADEQIILENLHPEHPRLVTKLPGVRPRARVETQDAPGWDLLLVADTLWIDTLRGICTVTWRGQVPLNERDQPGVVRIALEEPGRPLRWPSSDAPPPPREADAAADAAHDFGMTATDDEALRGIPAPAKPVLPFQRSGAPRPPAPPMAVAMPKKPLATLQQRGPVVELWAPDDHTETVREAQAPPRSGMPTWLEAPPASTPAPPPVVPPRPPLVRQSDPFLGAPTIAPVVPPAPISSPTGFGLRPPDPPAIAPRADDKALASAAYVGVLEASNAAAEPPPPPPRRAPMRSEPPAALPPRTLVEVVWYDAAKVARLRKTPAFEPHLRPPSPPPAAPAGDPEAAARAAEEKTRAERADVAAVLARATPVLDVEGAVMDAATEDGDLEPPLVVVSGELELGLDEVKMLEAMLGAAGSFASGDKKLKEVIDLASEVMRTPLGASPGVAAGFVTRVREAWAKANRLLPADYLDVHTRRLLLEQRSYQKRELWNDAYIRALILPAGEGSGIPTYLPAALAKQLPLFARFPARVLAEAFPQQDQLETHPVALRATALGRVVTGRGRR